MVQNFDLGEFIREQRRTAQISVRQLAKLAGVSNPYLSQIERGLRRPSAEIMQQIAKGLRISAEALYVQAGILDERVVGGVVIDAIIADPTITERQKQVMVEVYDSFRKENLRRDADEAAAIRAQASDAARIRRDGGGVEVGRVGARSRRAQPLDVRAFGLWAIQVLARRRLPQHRPRGSLRCAPRCPVRPRRGDRDEPRRRPV